MSNLWFSLDSHSDKMFSTIGHFISDFFQSVFALKLNLTGKIWTKKKLCKFT